MPRGVGWCVDPSQPVEWGHPLNRGRFAWWLGLPQAGFSGSNLIRDITRPGYGGNHGSLIGPSTWRPNGLGHQGLQYSSTARYEATLPGATASTQAASCAAWVYLTSRNNYAPVLETRPGGGGSLIGLLLSNKTGNPLTASWNGTVSEYAATTGLTVPLNEWVLCGMSVSGTALTAYRVCNSLGPAKFGITITATSRSMAATWYSGYDGTAASGVAGQTADLSVWPERVLAEQDFFTLFEHGRRGYRTPDSPLRWVTGRTYFAPLSATPSVFAPAFGPGWGFAA